MAVLAHLLLKVAGDPDPKPHPDSPGQVNISIAPLRMVLVLLLGHLEEPLDTLPGDVPGLPHPLLPVHGALLETRGIKDISTGSASFLGMSIKVDPDMEEYIKNSSTEFRICTTCEGPILLPVRLRPPKPTDLVMTVQGRKLYISVVQARRIKVIDSSMLPKCTLKNRKWF